MRIKGLRTRIVSVPYRRPFGIRGGTSAHAISILVEMMSDDGVSGLGEAAPLTPYSGETAVAIQDAIDHWLGPAILDLDPLDLELLHTLMDSTLQGHHFAKAAIDLACHDLIGKSLGLPIYALLGGRFRREVPLTWVIGLGSDKELQEMTAEAVEYARLGFAIKVKIGQDAKRDLRVVGEIRQAIGPDVRLRVDANQGYDLPTAIRTLRAMERFDLELIEQPVSRDRLDDMKKVSEALDTPVMADESLFSEADAIQLVSHHAADIFNIKLMKVGGLLKAKRVAAIAEAAGIPCIVGSMPELGIATAAGIHFASALRCIQLPSEVIGPLMTTDDIVAEAVLDMANNPGRAVAPSRPGLGVSLRPEYAF